MADKTTTLKTKTNDNVYPNVIGDNRKNAFVDSSTITHHFYDQTHKLGFQIANETNIKIQNSLQKPKGLTKTELVGVGANGQESIEIGDNLTLANGKLSATGGGSGGLNIITPNGSDFDGNLSKDKINVINSGDQTATELFKFISDGNIASYFLMSSEFPLTFAVLQQAGDRKFVSVINANVQSYCHMIELTSPTLGEIYFNYTRSSDDSFNSIDKLKDSLVDREMICSGYIIKDGKRLIAMTINGNSSKQLLVRYLDDTGQHYIEIDNTFTIKDSSFPIDNQ